MLPTGLVASFEIGLETAVVGILVTSVEIAHAHPTVFRARHIAVLIICAFIPLEVGWAFIVCLTTVLVAVEVNALFMVLFSQEFGGVIG